MSKIRCSSYQVGRTLGDLEAARQGPLAYVKRRIRRVVYRKTNQSIRRILRAAHLSK